MKSRWLCSFSNCESCVASFRFLGWDTCARQPFRYFTHKSHTQAHEERGCFGASCIPHRCRTYACFYLYSSYRNCAFQTRVFRLSHSRDKSGSMVENGVVNKYSIVLESFAGSFAMFQATFQYTTTFMQGMHVQICMYNTVPRKLIDKELNFFLVNKYHNISLLSRYILRVYFVLKFSYTNKWHFSPREYCST